MSGIISTSAMNNFCSCAKLSTVENYVLVVQEFFIGCTVKLLLLLFLFLPTGVWKGTLSLRVCAMYGFNRRVFVSLSIAAITTVAFGAVSSSSTSDLNVNHYNFKWAIVGPKIFLETSVPGCHTVTPHDQQVFTESRRF